MHLDHAIIGKILTSGAPNMMSTLSHKRGITSSTIKKVIFIYNDHSELHKGSTSNTIKRLNIKRCGCMIQFLHLISIFELDILFLEDVELNSKGTLIRG